MRATLTRRAFVAGMVCWIVSAATYAQEERRVARIGVLASGTTTCLDGLRQGLSDGGYREGQTHVLEIRHAETHAPFAPLAGDLVKSGVDLIVSLTTEATVAAKQATSRIPIVMAASSYPVELGIVAGLSRPGGNVTGIATFTGELFAKRLQLLAQAVPGASRFAVLRVGGHRNTLIVNDLQAGARRLGVGLHVIEVNRAEDLPGAFQVAARAGSQAIMTTQASLFVQNRAQIAALALEHRMPSLSGEPGAVEAGTLMSYGPNVVDSCRKAAVFVDRIVKGGHPGDIPVEQPTAFELAINLKTAKALGLTIPPLLLLRADHVIE